MSITKKQLISEVGKGPARFGGFENEISLAEQLKSLPLDRVQDFAQLTIDCEEVGIQRKFTPSQILRVGKYTIFDRKQSISILKRMDPRNLNITAKELETQLLSKTLFPLPSLKANDAQDMFYMRPSRYVPGQTSVRAIIANLIYVMDTFYDQHRDSSRKMGFIANMNDWTMENFSISYCMHFMEALQGAVAPVSVGLFLIVNPPSWFDKVWKIMKPMLAASFRKKVHMIKETDLSRFLKPGFEKYIPNEFNAGLAKVDDLVRDFVAYRKFIEQKTGCRTESKENKSLLVPRRSNHSSRRNSVDGGKYVHDSSTTFSEPSFNSFHSD